MLNKFKREKNYALKVCWITQNVYICIVFFMVLDLRLTMKIGCPWWIAFFLSFFVQTIPYPRKNNTMEDFFAFLHTNRKGNNQHNMNLSVLSDRWICFNKATLLSSVPKEGGESCTLLSSAPKEGGESCSRLSSAPKEGGESCTLLSSVPKQG